MAKRCRNCGHLNSDDLPFCSECGSPVNKDLELVMKLDEMNKHSHAAAPVQKKNDDDDYVHIPLSQQKKSSGKGWIIAVAVIAVIAVAAWLLFF